MFQQVEGISLTGEDAAGEAYAVVDALASGPDGQISAGEGTVRVMPAVGSNEEMDLFGLVLDYRDSVARGFDQVIVIVGSNQYFFSSGAYPICQQTQPSDGTFCETLTLLLDSSSIQLMEDLKAHRDETVQIVLTGTMKDGILKLYNLYAAAGGTNQTNLDKITSVQYTAIETNQLQTE